MAVTFLTFPYEFQGGRKAIASQVNANFEAIKEFAGGVNVTIDELKKAITELKDKPVREMLDIFYSFSSVAPTGAYPLWTGETILYCKSLYPQFWKKVNNLSKLGNLKTVTSAEYEERLQKYDQCGAFYIDEINGHIRLPKITRFISGINDLAQLSQEEEAGLPNITGTVGNLVGYYGVSKTGAFEKTAQRGLAIAYHQGGTCYADLNFDASSSSSVYGKSETVQPPAVNLCLYLQVANSFAEVSEVDVESIIKQMQMALSAMEASYETYQKGLLQTYDEIKGKIQEASAVVKLKDVSVEPEAFVSDNTYEQYPFRADIADPDIRENMVPNVCFNLDDATGGNYAPVADCVAGTLHIYAKEKPTSTLIIPSIVLE